ncbi:PadR family transcriptional regulator [Microbacterium sp. ACRRU]|uniref:PadR family transcriptional regulator n=1 Tax=Microbacterium sp. ACRRU TaxID=2918204 RepID=UPI001EF4B8BA|nr:PadR family transcriptional regulator [Microbacterium sp. ACRRU]MCG7417234.1 PadR family transcriptional regulator [Microbacterium sp. ACRRU]
MVVTSSNQAAPQLTPAELTILGLIVEQPRHGYDLERVIEKRGVRKWTDIGFSSIYYVIAKLERRGLVETDAARAGAKSRRVFRATAAGHEVAAAETAAFLSELQTVAHPFLVGLANSSLVPEHDYVRALQDRLQLLEARISSVTEAEARQSPLPRAAREVFSYSLSLLEAERSWLAARVLVPREDPNAH